MTEASTLSPPDIETARDRGATLGVTSATRNGVHRLHKAHRKDPTLLAIAVFMLAVTALAAILLALPTRIVSSQTQVDMAFTSLFASVLFIFNALPVRRYIRRRGPNGHWFYRLPAVIRLGITIHGGTFLLMNIATLFPRSNLLVTLPALWMFGSLSFGFIRASLRAQAVWKTQ